MTRRSRTFAATLVVVVALTGAAACGIDEDELATGATTTSGDRAGTSGSSTSTTEAGGPDISLPDIPSDVTEPDETVPDPTEGDQLPSDQETPGGFTPEGIRDALVADANLTEEQATCVSIGVFATFDGETIDVLFTADETSEVDPDVVAEFEDIVLTCVQGG